VDSAPASALHRIDLATGSEVVVRPIEGLSFQGALSGASTAWCCSPRRPG